MAVLNSFLSYLLLFALLVVLAVAGAFVGVHLRKRKDAKEENAASDASDETRA